MRRPEFTTIIAPVLLVLVVALVYGRTLAPGVTTEDSGELITAAATWGVPHPPGFPLYCLLVGSIVRLVPASPAWSTNAASALFGLWAAIAVYATLRRLETRPWIAAAASASLAFGRTFWSQSVIAEVYSLNAALLATSMLLLVTWSSRPPPRQDRWFLGAVLAAGLGLANHHPLTLLAAPGLAAFAIAVDRSVLVRPRLLFGAVVALSIGLGAYAYLPWAAARHPPINWGDPADAARFIAHVTRRAYRELEFGDAPTWRDKVAFFGDFLRLWAFEHGGLGVPLAAYGAFALRRTKVAWLLGGVVLFNPIVLLLVLRFRFEAENIMRVNEYYLPVYVVTALALGLGLDRASRHFSSRWPTSALSLAIVVAPLALHWRGNDRSRDHLAEDFSRAVLGSLEHGALYFPSGDYAAFPALYLTAVEGVRRDVILGSYSGDLSQQAREYLTEIDARVDPKDTESVQRTFIMSGTRPVYFASKSDVRWFDARLEPWGLVYRARRPREPRATSVPGVREADVLRNANDARLVVDDLGRSIRADVLLMEGEHLARSGDLKRARESFVRAEAWLENSKEGLNNLGSTLAELGLVAEAERIFRKASSLSPRYVTPRRNLAILLDRLGRRADAVRAFEELVELVPGDKAAAARLDALRSFPPGSEETPRRPVAAPAVSPATPLPTESSSRSSSALSNMKLTELEAIVRAQPKNAASWNNLGSGLAEAGRPHEAKEAFERAIGLDPTYALPHRNLALLFATQLHDSEEARRHEVEYNRLMAEPLR